MWTIPRLTPFDFRETLLYFLFLFPFRYVFCFVVFSMYLCVYCSCFPYVLFIYIEDNVSFRFGGVRLLVIVFLLFC